MAFQEDLSQFFDTTGGFAVTAQFTTDEGVVNVDCIFNDPTQSVELYDASVEAGDSYLLCEEDEVVNVKRGDPVTVNGKNFKVLKVRSEGTGLANVYLNS